MSLNETIRKLYNGKKLVKLKPAQLQTHLFDTKEFKRLFGTAYREIVSLLTEDRSFFELTLISTEIRTRGQLEPILVDEDNIVIDGGTRATILSALGMEIEAFQLPIRCRESDLNMALCTAIALATLKKKGMGEKFRQLVALLRPGFEKVGIPVAEVLGVDLEAIAGAAPPKVEAEVEAPPEARKAVEYWVEKTVEALNLSKDIIAFINKLMELAPPEQVFRDELKVSNRAILTVRSLAVAKAYVYLALRMSGCSQTQLNAVLNYDPLHGKSPKSTIVNRMIGKLESYLKEVHGIDWREQMKIVLRVATERVYNAHSLDRRGISKEQLQQKVLEVWEEYEPVIKQASPVPAIRAALTIAVALKRLGIRDIAPTHVLQTLGAVKGALYYIKKRLAEKQDEKVQKFLQELTQ